MNDPDAPGGKGFTHWIMWNMELVSILPEDIPKAPAIKFPVSASQGRNNFGTSGYSGPCPPHGQTHRYDIKVYGRIQSLTWNRVPTKIALSKPWPGMLFNMERYQCDTVVSDGPVDNQGWDTHSFQFYRLCFMPGYGKNPGAVHELLRQNCPCYPAKRYFLSSLICLDPRCGRVDLRYTLNSIINIFKSDF